MKSLPMGSWSHTRNRIRAISGMWTVNTNVSSHMGLKPCKEGISLYQPLSAFRYLIHKKQEACLHKECLNHSVILVFLIDWSLFLENPVLPQETQGFARNGVGSYLNLVWSTCLLTIASSKHPSLTLSEKTNVLFYTKTFSTFMPTQSNNSRFKSY